MSRIVVLSLSAAIIAGAFGLEWSEVRNAAFVFAALAAVIFVSALDAWETEEHAGPIEDKEADPASSTVPALGSKAKMTGQGHAGDYYGV
jgi:hypothetical protein